MESSKRKILKEFLLRPFSLEKTYPVLPRAGEAQIRLFNGQSCGCRIESTIPHHSVIDLPPHSLWTEKHILLRPNQTTEMFKYNVSSYGNGTDCETVTFDGEFKIESQQASSYFLTSFNKLVEYVDSVDRSTTTLPAIRILMTGETESNLSGVVDKEVVFHYADSENPKDSITFRSDIQMLHEIDAGIYFVYIDHTQVGAVELRQGGTYTIVISEATTNNFVSGNPFRFNESFYPTVMEIGDIKIFCYEFLSFFSTDNENPYDR